MPATPAPGAGAPSDAELKLGRSMQRSLAALLDQVRGSREAMPHLAALETALGEQGAAAVADVPPHFLPKLLQQLRVLPISSEDTALAELHKRVQLRARTTSALPAAKPPAPPAAANNSAVVVSEGSHSDFMKVLGEAGTPALPR